MPESSSPDLLALYPALAALPSLVARLTPMTVPPGTRLFRENDACQGFPLVLTGEVRVSRAAPNGRELELYRVAPGEMCLVSSAGLFAQQPLTARGITTSVALCERLLDQTGVALLPGAVFGRDEAELTARLAYVDFDGARALAAVSVIPREQPLDENFLRRHCPRVVEAVERITAWIARKG